MRTLEEIEEEKGALCKKAITLLPVLLKTQIAEVEGAYIRGVSQITYRTTLEAHSEEYFWMEVHPLKEYIADVSVLRSSSPSTTIIFKAQYQ